MTDHDAFLARIIASPDDDLPRLVYADWLEERGQPGDAERAAFIRVQCEATKEIGNGQPLTRERGDRLVDIGCRQRSLFDALAARQAFDVGLPTGCQAYRPDPMACSVVWGDGPNAVTLKMVRGFIEEVTLSAADWLQHGDAIRARHPVVRVRLTNRPTSRWDWHRATGRLLMDGVDRWPGVAFELPAAAEFRQADFTQLFAGVAEAGARAARAYNQTVFKAIAGPLRTFGDSITEASRAVAEFDRRTREVRRRYSANPLTRYARTLAPR